MSDWQERITRDTAPAIRVEHELRYRLAAPLIADSAVWADLGCGNGVAAAAALQDRRPGRTVLVDRTGEVVAGAARELALEDAVAMTADLSDPADLETLGRTLLEVDGHALVTCFEVVEHLESFVPLLTWSTRMTAEHDITFVISVPNDAFWSIENPHHRSVWGEGSFEELRRLLPEQQTLLRQVALAGSGLVDWEGTREAHQLEVSPGGPGSVATHFIAAFGPRHAQLARGALAVEEDTLAQRRWERQRESDLAVAQALVSEREEWRAYIHELERELGRPVSGSAAAQRAEKSDQPT
jgi:SAM-dependent methyltransferase